MPRVLNPNLAKIHRNYTVEEVAKLFGVHKNSVRAWVKGGLPICDSRRPLLILGRDLRDFIRSKRQARKGRCGPTELYCLSCRVPRRPAGDMADYVSVTSSTGRLVAICPVCSAMMNRYVGMRGLDSICMNLDVRLPKALQHLSDTSKFPANSDFK